VPTGTKAAAPPITVKVGEHVVASGREGYVRFIGSTEFAQGEWIGVELLEPSMTRTDALIDDFRRRKE